MKHNMFVYLLNEGFKNVFKNKKSAGASLAIMCATMLIFGLFFVVVENINNIVENLEAQQGMQVFINKDATEDQMTKIGENIKAIDGVNTITFVSKEDALNSMKEKLKDNKNLLDGWELDNPFKASYVVTLTDLTKSTEIQDQILKIDNVASITSKDETISALVTIANGVRVVSGVVIALLIIISIFIISNTIKLTVHARRKEISIMKYVGATDSFIRWPFIIEGIIIGILAAAISILLVGVVYTLAANALEDSTIINKMGVALLTFKDMFRLIITVYLGIGIGIGALGSAISMRKYLKV